MTDKEMVEMLEFKSLLQESKIDYLIGVPCSNFSKMLEFFEKDKEIKLIYVPKENDAIGIQIGLWMAGKRSLIFSQNSGIGNMVNALTSFCHTYSCPFFALISWRGYDGKDAPEHTLMGRITHSILDIAEIHAVQVDGRLKHFFKDLAHDSFVNGTRRSAMLITSKDFMDEQKAVHFDVFK